MELRSLARVCLDLEARRGEKWIGQFTSEWDKVGGWKGEEELVIHTELHLSFDMSGMISSIGTNGWRDGEMVRLSSSPSQYVRCYDTHVS